MAGKLKALSWLDYIWQLYTSDGVKGTMKLAIWPRTQNIYGEHTIDN